MIVLVVEQIDVDGIAGDHNRIGDQIAIGKTGRGNVYEDLDGFRFACSQNGDGAFDHASWAFDATKTKRRLLEGGVGIQRVGNDNVEGVGGAGIADQELVTNGAANARRVGEALFDTRRGPLSW